MRRKHMQSKQTHTNTPRHDDPCDDWMPIGKLAQRIIDEYEPYHDHDPFEDEAFARTFSRFARAKS